MGDEPGEGTVPIASPWQLRSLDRLSSMAPKRRSSARAQQKAANYKENSEPNETEHTGTEILSDDDTGAITTAKRRKVQGTKKKPSTRKKVEEQDADELLALIGVAKGPRSTFRSTAQAWAQAYQENKTQATANVLTFLIQAAGSSSVITDTDVDEGEVDETMQALVTGVTTEGFTDHFNGKGQKAFASNYLELWEKLITEGHTAEFLADGFFLDKLIHLLIGLNCSVVRNFRYVATLTAQQIVSSLVAAQLLLGEARETAQRQLDAEKSKKGSKERMASFQRTLDRCHSQAKSLEASVGAIWQGIFSARFRDVDADIRAVVIRGIGDWMSMNPADFLNDAYLKYVAWALSDRDALVRETALTALLDAYKLEENLSPLHAFTTRFQSRFAELVYDKSEAVAVKGIQLVTLLVKAEEMPQEQARDLYRLLVEDSTAIRHAAAELAAGMLEPQGQRFLAQSPSKGRKGKGASKPSSAQLQLAGLLQILKLLGASPEQAAADAENAASPSKRRQSKGSPVHPAEAAYVVDGLFEHVEVLHDWRAMVDALIDDQANEARGDAATTNLILLLSASVHRAVAAPQQGSRPNGRKVTGRAKAATAAASARQEITLALSQPLLGLLRKFRTEPIKVAALVDMVRDLKLDIFSLKRQEEGLEALAQQIAELLAKHSDGRVIEACAQTLQHCAAAGPDVFKDKAGLIMAATGKDLAKRLAAAVSALTALSEAELREERQSEESGEEASVLALALRRVAALLRASGAPAQEPATLKPLQKLLAEAAKGRVLPPECMKLAIDSTQLLLLWSLRDLEQSAAPASSAITALAKAVASFGAQLDEIGAAEEDTEVQRAIQKTQSNLFLVFSKCKLKGSALASLAYTPDSNVLDAFWQRTAAILAETPDQADDDLELDDEEDEQGAKTASSAAAQALAAAQREAIAGPGRLVALQMVGGLDGEVLAGRVLMQLGSPQKAVTEAVREVIRILKKTQPASVPQMYVAALKEAYQAALEAGGEAQGAALQLFGELGQRIAASYAGFVSGAANALLQIVKGGIDYALQEGAELLPFLEGLSPLVARLPAREASSAAQHLEAMAAPHRPIISARDWAPYEHMLEELQARADKDTRKERAAAPSKKPAEKKRRISFVERNRRAARGEPIEEDEEAEGAQEEADAIQDPEEATQRPPRNYSLHLNLPRDVAPESSGRQEWAGQGEDEEMEEMNIDQDAAEPSIEEDVLMPTEEQAAFHRKHSRGKERKQLKRMVETEEEEPSATGNDSEDEDEDADLLEPVIETRARPAVDIGRLSGLGASLPEGQDEDEEEESEEEEDDDSDRPMDNEPRRARLRLR